MEKVIENETQRQRQKKFLLVLPLLALPFMALFFWAFGGGKGDNNAQAAAQKGINTELPSAQFKGEKPQDKLSLYDQAAKDSANTNRKAANPLFSHTGNGTASTTGSADASAMRLNQKLAELNHEISQPQPPARFSGSQTDAGANPDIDRLEKLLRQKTAGNQARPGNGTIERNA